MDLSSHRSLLVIVILCTTLCEVGSDYLLMKPFVRWTFAVVFVIAIGRGCFNYDSTTILEF